MDTTWSDMLAPMTDEEASFWEAYSEEEAVWGVLPVAEVRRLLALEHGAGQRSAN